MALPLSAAHRHQAAQIDAAAVALHQGQQLLHLKEHGVVRPLQQAQGGIAPAQLKQQAAGLAEHAGALEA
ncbi:MAG: hypothetical protein ACKO8I_12755 [Cyanobacteriota bacterium]